jgi:hypothetical protein
MREVFICDHVHRRRSRHRHRRRTGVTFSERDRRAWLEAHKRDDDDLLGADRPAARWRPSTKELYVRNYGFWLNFLGSQGLLDPKQPPEARVTQSRVAAYLQAECGLGNSARTLVNHAVGLRHMFEALAPAVDWKWMLPALGKLKSRVAATKNHSDLPSIKELFDLGMLLMRRAEGEEGGSPKQRAVLYRNGLSIAVLAARPFMRRQNLATMRIGQHIVKDGSLYRLKFSGDDMKGRRGLGGPLPGVLTALVDKYVEVHRPVLFLGKPDVDGTLFISGGPLDHRGGA